MPAGACWELHWRRANVGDWQKTGLLVSMSHTLEQLQPGTAYQLKARGCYKSEDGNLEHFQFSVVAKVKTKASAQAPPSPAPAPVQASKGGNGKAAAPAAKAQESGASSASAAPQAAAATGQTFAFSAGEEAAGGDAGSRARQQGKGAAQESAQQRQQQQQQRQQRQQQQQRQQAAQQERRQARPVRLLLRAQRELNALPCMLAFTAKYALRLALRTAGCFPAVAIQVTICVPITVCTN